MNPGDAVVFNAIKGLVSVRVGVWLDQVRAFNDQLTLFEAEVTPAGLRKERWSEWLDQRVEAIRFARERHHPARVYELVLDMRPEQAEFGHIWLGRVIDEEDRHVHRATLRYPPSPHTFAELWPEISACMECAIAQVERDDAR